MMAWRFGLSGLVLGCCLASAAAAGSWRFVDGTEDSGIAFRHQPFRTAERRMPETLGSGVVLADFNRDGAVDVLLVNSGKLGAAERPAGAENRLFINDGRGRFSDRTREWQLPSPGYGMGAVAGDIDNDGWPDLFLTTFDGPDTLLRNAGGRFVDVTRQAGIEQDGSWSAGAGFFDLEGDGDLDLWVVRYVRYDPEEALPCYASRQRVYCTPVLFDALPGRLLRNDGGGRFADISAEVNGSTGKGLGLAVGDVDGDGLADVYVAHDTTPNHLWMNRGGGRLEEVGLLAGVAVSELGAELAGMGAEMSDVNGDGRVDLAVTNFENETTSIYLQARDGVFREVSDAVGIGRSARERLKFGLDFFDADNDGDEDLLVANGHLYDNVETISRSSTFAQPNSFYENLGDGRFRDVTSVAGPALDDAQVSRGLATGDLDGDGDLDFVVTNNGGTAQVGRNESEGSANFVSLWLEGRVANRSAIGARVVARVGERTIERQVLGASSYLSQSDPRLHIGLGAATAVDELTIFWPGSAAQKVPPLAAGRHYRIIEGLPPEPYVPGAAELPRVRRGDEARAPETRSGG